MLAKKLGRPSKYSTEKKKSILRLYRGGKTDAEVSNIIGISEKTLNNWKKFQLDFLQSVQVAKAEADEMVIASLFKRGIGYRYVIQTTCPNCGYWANTTKEEPPNTRACIFWLKNRSEEWK